MEFLNFPIIKIISVISFISSLPLIGTCNYMNPELSRNETMVYANNFLINIYMKNACVESVFNIFSYYLNLINIFPFLFET